MTDRPMCPRCLGRGVAAAAGVFGTCSMCGGSGFAPVVSCVLCSEPMGGEPSTSLLQPMHRECSLRSVIGGIGHLIAHNYWCQRDDPDPDAGLTFRQSALLVDLYVALVGVDAAVER